MTLLSLLNGLGQSDAPFIRQEDAMVEAALMPASPKCRPHARWCPKRHRLVLLFSLTITLVLGVLAITTSPRRWPLLALALARPTYTPKPSILAPECVALNHTDVSIDRCLTVTQACVDMNEVVMMGDEYQYDVLHPAWAPGAVAPLPSFEPSVHYTPQYGSADTNGDFFVPGQPLFDPVPFRARSWLEASQDLLDPQYDNSTIPIVFHPAWPFNFAHVATSSLSWIWNNINQSSNAALRERARLVVRTPHGWALPPYMQPLLQPLLRHKVITFAELSQRPAPGSIGAAPRCYCRMLVCDSYHHTKTPNVWKAARAMVTSHIPPPEAPAKLPAAAASSSQPEPDGQRAADAAAAAAAQSSQLGSNHQQAADTAPAGRRPPVRRIVFHRRGTQVRQIINLPQLLEQCSRWSWGACAACPAGTAAHSSRSTAGPAQQAKALSREAQLPPAGAAGAAAGSSEQPSVECSVHQFTGFADSLATSQATDVYVGTHGANIANGLLMRPGSAIVEILHPQWPFAFHEYLQQDPDNELIYFGLIVKESAWTAGFFEELQRTADMKAYNGRTVERDRNINLKWEWLEPVLARIAALNGNLTAWRELPIDQIIMHIK